MSHELDKINRDIASLASALSQTPDDHPSMPLLLASLGRSHMKRFDLLNQLDDLEKAIEYRSITLALTPDNDPGLSELLFSLTIVHYQRFQRLRDPYDIEKAIEYGYISVDLATDGDSALALRLANLGTAHNYRFENLGELTDLEDAIKCNSRAVALTPDGDPYLPGTLSSLGVSHTLRFRHLGELTDIRELQKYGAHAVALTPDGHPALPDILMYLGVSYFGRFQQLGELSDVENAIEYQSGALALSPDGHASLFVNLGWSHHIRFERLGELRDLEKAVEYHSRALALTPNGHPGLPRMLTSLGASYSGRFERLGELSDLEDAIEYQSRGLALTPDGHPDMPGRLANLGSFHHSRFKHLGDHYHLQHSLELFQSASQSLSSAPRDRFRNAQYWANIASIHSPDNCIEAYQTAIDLLPQFIWLGATTNQRYEDLSTTGTLAVDAAFAAIRCSNYSLALEWLEHTRCVVWNQSLMLRSPLDQLQSVDSDLGSRLQAVANRLHNASSNSREAQALASGSITIEQVAQEHHRLAKEYDDLLVQIRTLPGFNGFLRPVKAAGLVQAARTGLVVVINCHQEKCDALIILPGEQTVGHIPLPKFSAQEAQQAQRTLGGSLKSKGIRERGVKIRQEPGHSNGISSVLETLWHYVVKPVLDHLGFVNDNSYGDLPHIIWCPTGPLSFLPLHAAGDYDQPRSRVFDYVVSSYTPTLTALLASSPSLSSTSCRVLAIGQPNTPEHSALPGTARELAYVQEHTSRHSHYSRLNSSQATVAAVLDAMEQHDWVHFACHAHQNVSDPTKSGFFLHDGTLDLAEINRRSFKGKGLAFLSACQTATGDERLADEAIHLASGMLMAGYSSVIATMWSVHDEDAPLVADKVYARLMKDGKVGNGEAGRALHDAVATLRDRVGEQKFERWVPYIHIGS
ncbi:aromatic di-alanine and TPR containing protein [Rhizoctonia solani AG-3 Rhs1AP]|uniref:Aromatic di-alanine and TPR containing protein n=1 Tax=Rhizoctonia solani AG-3 Rhs1AP TaxID=1086054 RepID=X8J6V1_9AGAM|nr:aromatic di-alanine and TPR containing protein [Rhizoctonia solani AG-3 Rhs1AP]